MNASVRSSMNKANGESDIDIVILWVDGNDPQWLDEKRKYQNDTSKDANAPNRFRDWGLMKYWFRSIENFAPWVRMIHFVTWGHVPGFLNLEHPKIHIVRHEDYLPAEALPTFNASAIEMSIHRIPGLSEHFLFFNDDMFLLRPVGPDTFFHHGLPCLNGSERFYPPGGKILTWYAMLSNDVGLINKHFTKKNAIRNHFRKYVNHRYSIKENVRTLAMEILYKKFVGFALPHSISAFRKSVFEEVWRLEQKNLQATTMHKFRDFSDVNQWLILWWQIASGQFYPSKVDSIYFSADNNAVDALCNTIKAQDHDMICINDPDYEIDFEMIAQKTREAFESILPNKCSYEK